MSVIGRSPAEPLSVPAAVIDMRGLIAVLQRQRNWILWSAAAFTVLGIIVAFILPVRYTATAQILLDVHGLQVLQGDLTPHADRSADAQLADAESQLQVISSSSVLMSVVESERLQDDPEFGGAGPGFLSSLFGGYEDRVLKAARTLQSRMGTRRPDKSFVIDVSVSSSDPNKSARLANAIAKAYLDRQIDSRTDASKRTSGALVSRLAELKDRASRSARRVEDFKEQNEIVGAGGELVSEQQLTALNKQLADARGLMAEKRARYEDIQRLQRNGAEPAAIAEAIESPTITALRSQYAEAKQAEANKSAILGPRHPAVIAAAAQVAQSQRRIEEELSRIAETALSEYNRARANEEQIEKSVSALKTDVTQTNQKFVRLRELQSEAESDRAVYVAFLNRAKEVGEQQDLNDTNSRIITEAVPPTTKSWPPRTLIIASSLLFGLVAGAAMGLLREQFSPTVYSAQQLTTDFGVRVLAELSDFEAPPSPVFSSQSPEAAAMRRALGAVRSRARGKSTDIVLVTSLTDSTDIRSIIALNLAICAGAEGADVLLVMGHSIYHDAAEPLDRSTEQQPERLNFGDGIVQTPWPGVELLMAPSGEGAYRNMTDRLRDALADAAADFDFIVIDDEFSLGESVARRFPKLLDNIIMVVESGYTRRDRLKEQLDELLGQNPAEFAGVVLAA
jgi:polysaccharide biosynthesis transport protein